MHTRVSSSCYLSRVTIPRQCIVLQLLTNMTMKAIHHIGSGVAVERIRSIYTQQQHHACAKADSFNKDTPLDSTLYINTTQRSLVDLYTLHHYAMTHIPSNLPILPLFDSVLLPSIVTDLMLSQEDAHRISPNLATTGKGSYIVCVPLDPTSSSVTHGSLQMMPATTLDLSQLFHFGCTAEILAVDNTLPHTYSVRVKGICRSHIQDITTVDGHAFEAELQHHYPTSQEEENHHPQAKQLRKLCQEYLSRMRDIGIPDAVLGELQRTITYGSVSKMVDWLLCVTGSTMQEKLRALETTDLVSRLQVGVAAVSCQLQVRKKVGKLPCIIL